MTWGVAPETQGSDHFPIIIRMDDDRRFAPKPNIYVVRCYSNNTFFLKDIKAIEASISANLHASTINLFFPVYAPAPDVKYANIFAARRFGQRRYRRSGRREGRLLFNRLNSASRVPANCLRRQSWRDV